MAERIVVEQVEFNGSTYDLVKPTTGDKVRVIEAAHKAGEIDAKGEAAGITGGIKLSVRVVTALLFKDGKPAFDPQKHRDQLLDTYGFEELAEKAGRVFRGESEEKLRGE
jgi:hypothetical protein